VTRAALPFAKACLCGWCHNRLATHPTCLSAGGSLDELFITPELAVHGDGFDPFSNPGFPSSCCEVLFETVTVTVGELPTLVAASYALITSEWLPFATELVFHENDSDVEFVLEVVSTPSMYSSILTTPTLSEAVAVMVVKFDTVAPFAGAVMEAAGGVESLPEPGVVTISDTSSTRNVVGEIDPLTA